MTDLMEGLRNHEWFHGFDISDELPERFSLEDWVKLAKETQATVFIAGNLIFPLVVIQVPCITDYVNLQIICHYIYVLDFVNSVLQYVWY